ncbi:hypothetical protein D3C75_1080430 [compost metagenome]
MNMKKTLFSSVLSLALLVSAAPAFASEGNVSVSAKPSSASVSSDVTIQSIVYRYVYNSVNQFANSFADGGIMWYLKAITYSNGQYIGHYEGRTP